MYCKIKDFDGVIYYGHLMCYDADEIRWGHVISLIGGCAMTWDSKAFYDYYYNMYDYEIEYEMTQKEFAWMWAYVAPQLNITEIELDEMVHEDVV